MPPVTTSAWRGQAVEEAAEPLELGGAVERSEVGVGHVGPADRLGLGLLDQGGHEVVVDPGAASTRVAAVQSWPALK